MKRCTNCRYYEKCKPFTMAYSICPQYRAKSRWRDWLMIVFGASTFIFVFGILPLLIHACKGGLP